MRKYFKVEKDKFEKLAEKLGAIYVEDGEAIFVQNTDWTKHIERCCDNVSYSKPAIRWKRGKGVDIGELDKECDNFEERTRLWYDKKSIEWIITTLEKIKKNMK